MIVYLRILLGICNTNYKENCILITDMKQHVSQLLNLIDVQNTHIDVVEMTCT